MENLVDARCNDKKEILKKDVSEKNDDVLLLMKK